VSAPLLISGLRIFRRYYEVINNFFRCCGLDLAGVIDHFLYTLLPPEICDPVELPPIAGGGVVPLESLRSDHNPLPFLESSRIEDN
jgi:hypothetical protein